jgi:trigger factor
MVELGGGRLLEDLEQGMRGAGPGEQRDIDVAFPDDYPAEHLAGKTASFAVTVKEVREKKLPELDDEFAADASEFDTLAELRADIEEKLRQVFDRRADELFRTAAVDAAVDAAEVDLPDEIVDARADEMVDRFLRQMEARGISREDFLRIQEGGEERLRADAKPDAERALKREAVMKAIADAEQLDVSEEEMLAALDPGPGHEDHGHDPPEKVLAQLRESGRDAVLREDLRLRKAVDFVVSSAKPIAMEQAEARERLWTPEKGRDSEAKGDDTGSDAPAEPGKLWTPGR